MTVSLGTVLLVACGVLVGSMIVGRSAWKSAPTGGDAAGRTPSMTPLGHMVTVVAFISSAYICTSTVSQSQCNHHVAGGAVWVRRYEPVVRVTEEQRADLQRWAQSRTLPAGDV